MLLPFCSQAQEFYPELETDRPDQTETASVVPLKSLQAESGFILESNHSGNLKLKSYTYTTTLLRYGMLKKVELRLGLDYLGNKTDLDDRVSRTCGFSPLYTGFKIKLNYEHNWRPDMAFIGGIFFPFTATNVYKPRSKGGEAKFSFSHSLSRNLSLGYNLGAEWDGETTDPYYSYSLALGINLSEKWGSYIEMSILQTVVLPGLSNLTCRRMFRQV
jgi:hypothetical protein